MAFDPANNPGRNKIATPATDVEVARSGASYWGETSTTATKTFSNACNLINIALYEAVASTGMVLAGFVAKPAVLRTATNFAYLLKNGADALALMSVKSDLGGKSA